MSLITEMYEARATVGAVAMSFAGTTRGGGTRYGRNAKKWEDDEDYDNNRKVPLLKRITKGTDSFRMKQAAKKGRS